MQIIINLSCINRVISIPNGIANVTFMVFLTLFSVLPFQSFSQTIPISGDQFHLYGPNTTWGRYLKIGGNGRNTTHASIVTTNGDLHLDSRDSSLLYLNHYSESNTIINPQGGNVGIGIASPTAKLHLNGAWNNLFRMGDGSSTNSGQFYSTYEGYSPVLNFGGNEDPFLFKFSQNAYQSNLYLSFHKGMMGIGVKIPDAMLTVNGQIHAELVKVDIVSGQVPDFVFENDYPLMSLEETEIFTKQHKHLPKVPSGIQMEQKGVELKEMNLLLLQKIEEMTLHLIEMNKRLTQQDLIILELQKELSQREIVGN